VYLSLTAVYVVPIPTVVVRVATRPGIVCLCGSTRFYDAFQQANYDETMAGRIVLSVGFYPHAKAQQRNACLTASVRAKPHQRVWHVRWSPRWRPKRRTNRCEYCSDVSRMRRA